MSGPTNNTYTGTCHCAQVKFSFSLPTPIEEQEVHECNCSICQINGYLLVYPKVTDIHFEHSDDDVKAYTFASKQIPHYFCVNCGTSVYAKCSMPKLSHLVAVNVRTLSEIDIGSLNVKKVNGRSLSL